MAKPKLNPPCPGWQRDLAGPNESTQEIPSLIWLTPSYLDTVYMELERNTLKIRGLVLWFSLGMALATIFYVIFQIWLFATTEMLAMSTILDMAGFALMDVSMCSFGVWATYAMYRADVSVPRDLPLRFNRLRRKVYVYGFHSVWWNPFTRWYVTTASYDWDDLRAEKWKARAATAGGAPIIREGVSIAVVKPGTNDVITRFDFSTTAANTTNLWAYVCSYMQNGIEGLDPDHAEPRDANDVAPYNLALRLAPKVEWPADMDRESRTAP
ncbi:DUF6708 domain-containing protein [Burkholderia sp. Ac-20349]|uniref:DUF6708 domain-containing protein n=1 Tax=Burkholderia sp. Ac-20349 TaxID=2703893 RepID=UPI001F11F1A3|nr:DUF6708 domain-containing protein [Burkholderia sp. Ac-20349]